MIWPPGLEANLTLRFLTHAAQAGTASGLNDVLLAAAAFAALGAVAGFAYGPDPTRQPPPRPAPGGLRGRIQLSVAPSINKGLGGTVHRSRSATAADPQPVRKVSADLVGG